MKVSFFTPVIEYKARRQEFDMAISNVLEEGCFILGKEVMKFEAQVKAYTGCKYAVGVASGTDGLTIASDLLDFRNNREVITSPFTFLASSSCIARLGGVPVFVDIDASTLSIDPNQIEYRITKKTAGILPVHLFNQMADMDGIMDISYRHNLKVLEDAAQAFGMNQGKGYAGTLGDMGVFSFFPTKTLGAYGDGGMIITNNESLYELALKYRTHGASSKYSYEYLGYNSRLDELQAAILNIKLNYIDESIKKRRQAAIWYIEGLKGCDGIKPVIPEDDKNPVYYVFNVLSERRSELCKALKENNIGFSIYYPLPLHLQKCFSYLGYKEGDFPIAERISHEILALPMYPELTHEEISHVCHTIRRFYMG